MSEAVAGDHIFSRYLAESAKMAYVIEDDASDEDDDDTGSERDDSDSDDDAGDSADDADEDSVADDSDEDDASDEDDDSDDGDDADDEDDGDGGGGDGDGGEDSEDGDSAEGENEEDPSKIEEADAFYVLYGLKIKGLKETTVGDALKQWGSNFLKGFGVKLIDGWGGSGGELHTVGGLVKGLRGLFGAIDDPDELSNRV